MPVRCDDCRHWDKLPMPNVEGVCHEADRGLAGMRVTNNGCLVTWPSFNCSLYEPPKPTKDYDEEATEGT